MLSHFQDNEKAAKAALRAAMLALRKEHAPTGAPARALLASTAWRKAAVIALYASLPLEAPTLCLLENAWQNGKKICLPKITNQETHQMKFFYCANAAELSPGPFGLQEPMARQECGKVDLMAIPGLAFDNSGSRLGYGGGYYDRFLASHNDFARIKIGLCHNFQVISHIPHDAYDMTIQGICTESGMRWL